MPFSVIIHLKINHYMRKITLLFFLLFTFFSVLKAAYQPVTLTVSSYNKDVIANGTGSASSSTTSGFDGSNTFNYVFVAQDYKNNAVCPALNPGQGLPVNGQLMMQGQFQLAPYSGNNALQLTSAAPSGTITLTTPVATTDFYLLAASGNGTGIMDMTVTFTDATTELFTGINIDNWLGGTNVVYKGSRITRNQTGCLGVTTAANGPNLYEFGFTISPANQSKPIASVSVTRTNTTAGEVINIMALSAAVPCTNAVAGTVSGISSVCNGQSFQLSSTFYSGNSLQWEESPQGTASWSAIPGATTSIFTKTGGQAIAMDYRAVVTCNASTSISNVITIGMSPFYDCYCSPLTGATLHTGAVDRITNVTITGTSLNSANGIGTSGYGYTKTNPSTATNTASLMQGAPYTIIATKTSAAGTNAVDGWIDYDQNGSFDAGEYISFSATSPSVGTVLVPASAPTGLTGMRLRYRFTTSTFGASGACVNSGNETEDYTVTIVPAVNCSGVPSAAIASAASNGVCPNTAFTLSAANLMIGSGISYQWEELPSGGSWNPITGATSAVHIISAGITIPTDYRLVTSCAFGGTANSNIVSMAVNLPTQCYCTPAYTGGCTLAGFDARIDGVSIPGANSTSIANTGSGCSVNGYGSYLNLSANLEQAVAYTASLNLVNSLSSLVASVPGVALWIDLDDDGVFSSTERLVNMTSAVNGGAVTLNFVIPPTAPLGAHRLRLRYTYDGTLMDPCSDLGYGEAEDYMITVVPSNSCSGTPATPVISSSQSVICFNASFTLSATGATSGSGISYQWEEMPQGGGWTPIAGATNTSHTVTGGISVPTDYRLVISCTLGSSSTSNSVVVTPGSPAQCVCTPVYSQGGCNYFTYDARIESVSLPGANSTAITNTNSGCSANGYGTYLNLPVNLEQGISYAASLTLVNSISAILSATPGIAVWIDLDNDGIFSTTEMIASAVTPAGGGITTLGLPISLTAPLGAHRMRLRYAYNAPTPAAMDPCTDMQVGETEDYMVTIVPSLNCSGIPATPAASSSLSTVCGTTGFTLSATGATSGGGISYQWEEMPQGGVSWTPIANATGVAYTLTGGIAVPTDYRLVTTCSFGSFSNSNIVTVTPGSPVQCYCVPIYNYGCSAFGSLISRIEGVSLTGSTSTAISNMTSGCSPAGYGTYLNQSANLEQGLSYNVTMNFVDNAGGTPQVAIWMDLDNDGIFNNTTERLANVAATILTTTVSLAIPASALLGPHRMRIRYTYNIPVSVMDPCADLQLGETEDYMVTIIAPLTIKLIDISAKNEGTANIITWSTASEDQSDHFILEHSTNGKDYDAIVTLEARGHASAYDYRDETAQAGTSYYRLKMIAIDEEYSYSKVVSVYRKDAPGFNASLYPNPASATITVELAVAREQEIRYEMVNMIGKVIRSGKWLAANGTNKTKLDIASIASGKYFIRITGGDATCVLSFIKH
jgi:hypothetical protein